MQQGWSVFARDQKTEQQWIQELKVFQRSIGNALGNLAGSAHHDLYSMILIDHQAPNWQEWAKSVSREGRTLVLVMEETAFLPSLKDLGYVDDVLVSPFRMIELLSHYRQHQTRNSQQEIAEEMTNTREILATANAVMERILKNKTPKRFTGIKGISVMSRHLSGLKPGGDYFDVFESERKERVNFLLADSSSYGLSSALLGMILSSSARLASDANMNSARWISAIYEELKVSLGEKDHLSIFFGRLNRSDFALHYQMYGSCEAFIVSQDGKSRRLDKQGARIHAEFQPSEQEFVVSLNPKDRIVLLSDGFVNGVGGETYLNQLFQDQLHKDPFTLVNELSFQIKSKLSPGETFPGEDCSAIVIDVESRVLRLAPVG